jgi:TRAP-type transport system periplasmic protein
MRIGRKLVLLLCLVAGVTISLAAQTIKMGSLAPTGSPWDIALREIAAEWSRISGGKVTLKIYPGGITGGEADMLRKLRIGQLQAASFTTTGLAQIASDIIVLSLPLLIQSNEEYDYVLSKIESRFAEQLDEQGFTIMGWTNMGWLSFFTRKPVITPDDLRSQTLAFNEDSPEELQAWKQMGFNVIPLPTPDRLFAYQSGMADAALTSPLVAASYQWFAFIPNMFGVKLSPLIGGFVVENRAWKRVPSDLREELLTAAREVVSPLFAETVELEKRAIQTMIDNGLLINEIPEAVVAEWKQTVDDGFQVLIGTSISNETYETVKQHLADFRADN